MSATAKPSSAGKCVASETVLGGNRFGRIDKADGSAGDADCLMESGSFAHSHRQGQENLVAILPLAVERQEAARLRGEDISVHSGGGADCPIGMRR